MAAPTGTFSFNRPNFVPKFTENKVIRPDDGKHQKVYEKQYAYGIDVPARGGNIPLGVYQYALKIDEYDKPYGIATEQNRNRAASGPYDMDYIELAPTAKQSNARSTLLYKIESFRWHFAVSPTAADIHNKLLTLRLSPCPLDTASAGANVNSVMGAGVYINRLDFTIVDTIIYSNTYAAVPPVVYQDEYLRQVVSAGQPPTLCIADIGVAGAPDPGLSLICEILVSYWV
jgi:hypothetical protein